MTELPTEFSAQSRSGSIVVRTTEQGVPVGISVAAAELRQDPAALAAEVLRLCQHSARRAGLARRNQLADAGFAPEVLSRIGLPTEAEVAATEIVEEQEYETEPQSWLRSV
ncbi:hypothetical protein [Nocardia camponoti]|uniref:Uncharacterized protein n=1 Tax=Nocardia camponoti TaxID=1616106 RepID=A0A917QMU7_9NOCA|nr:hypothetical protein [Nocardia camponoti]GGK57552.1 hypothetical protein GCM10011591_32120 [Nocardia camponoti]